MPNAFLFLLRRPPVATCHELSVSGGAEVWKRPAALHSRIGKKYVYANATNIFSLCFLSRKISGVSCRSHLCCRDGNRGHARRGGKLRCECLPPPSSPRLAHSIMGGDGEPGLENLSAPFGGCAKPAIVGNFHDGGYTAPESLGIFHRGCAGSETFRHLRERERRQPETVHIITGLCRARDAPQLACEGVQTP